MERVPHTQLRNKAQSASVLQNSMCMGVSVPLSTSGQCQCSTGHLLCMGVSVPLGISCVWGSVFHWAPLVYE